MTAAVILGAVTAFALGARHGLDWDHVTAIADLVTPGPGDRRSLGRAVWYCLGHGSVIVLLGTLVGLLGLRLPHGLDRAFEVIVGGTLIALGGLVLAQIARQGRGYRFTGRWHLLLDLLRSVWLRRRAAVRWDRPAGHISARFAFAIGVLHGTGAETPTQVVLFAGAAAAGSAGGAALVLGAFVVGLIVSDLALALVWLSGRIGSASVPHGQLLIGVATGLASIGVGITFVLEKSAVLPGLIGG